jgi:hypothetical protein
MRPADYAKFRLTFSSTPLKNDIHTMPNSKLAGDHERRSPNVNVAAAKDYKPTFVYDVDDEDVKKFEREICEGAQILLDLHNADCNNTPTIVPPALSSKVPRSFDPSEESKGASHHGLNSNEGIEGDFFF